MYEQQKFLREELIGTQAVSREQQEEIAEAIENDIGKAIQDFSRNTSGAATNELRRAFTAEEQVSVFGGLRQFITTMDDILRESSGSQWRNV